MGAMSPAQLVTWNRLLSFAFDDEASALTLSKRLAREQGWNRSFARRVIGEYRKFLFLCVHAGHPVTPSEQVDAAWHLHMLYTRSYWEDLCGKALGVAVHHGPTKGGAAEDAKFHDWYGRTIASYERFFGPPARDVWPLAERRFETRARWVDLNEYWVIPKVRRGVIAAMGAGAAMLVGGGCGIAASGAGRSGGARGGWGGGLTLAVGSTGFLVVVGVVVLLAIILIAIMFLKNVGRGHGGSRQGCGAGAGFWIGATGGDGDDAADRNSADDGGSGGGSDSDGGSSGGDANSSGGCGGGGGGDGGGGGGCGGGCGS
jgi:hypothetical protein